MYTYIFTTLFLLLMILQLYVHIPRIILYHIYRMYTLIVVYEESASGSLLSLLFSHYDSS